MDKKKRALLEKKGWKIGSTKEFLGLTDEEAAYIELKLALSRAFHRSRENHRLTQVEAARLLRSSQSRVAKMEAADPSVSLDLLPLAPSTRGNQEGPRPRDRGRQPVPGRLRVRAAGWAARAHEVLVTRQLLTFEEPGEPATEDDLEIRSSPTRGVTLNGMTSTGRGTERGPHPESVARATAVPTRETSQP